MHLKTFDVSHDPKKVAFRASVNVETNDAPSHSLEQSLLSNHNISDDLYKNISLRRLTFTPENV